MVVTRSRVKARHCGGNAVLKEATLHYALRTKLLWSHTKMMILGKLAHTEASIDPAILRTLASVNPATTLASNLNSTMRERWLNCKPQQSRIR